jgi:hypothetical protein
MTDDEPTSTDKLHVAAWSKATVSQGKIMEGDLVRCAIAPYFFRVRITSGSMLLEPVSTEEATALAAEAGVLAEEKQT